MCFHNKRNSTKKFLKFKKEMCKNGHINYCLKKKIQKNENKINEMSAQISELQESNDLKLNYILNMSEELKTPLNIINGFSSLLTEKEYPREKQLQFYKNITNALNQMLLFNNQTLDIVYLEKEHIEPVYCEFKPSEIIKEILKIMNDIAQQKNISIFFDENDYNIIADKFLFKHVVFNLINNAIKYNKSGGTIEICTSIFYKSYKFKIKNSEKNISKELQNKIFQIFSINKKHPETSSNIALAYCKKIIDAQGGQLDFNPKEKKGSSILFTLPLFPNHLQDKYKLLKH